MGARSIVLVGFQNAALPALKAAISSAGASPVDKIPRGAIGWGVLCSLEGLAGAQGDGIPPEVPIAVLVDQLTYQRLQQIDRSRPPRLVGFGQLEKEEDVARLVASLLEELSRSEIPAGVETAQLGEHVHVEVGNADPAFVSLGVGAMGRFMRDLRMISELLGKWGLGNIADEDLAPKEKALAHWRDLMIAADERSREKGKPVMAPEPARHALTTCRRRDGAPYEGLPPPLLLLGETGTGKSLSARWLHHRLREAYGIKGQFLAVNCAGLPDNLLELELFGSLEHAFTDAADHPGKLLLARGGVVFLDEIGNMSPTVQAKLLTYLDSGTFHPQGWSHAGPIYSPVYLVAATNRPLDELRRRDSGFRPDLMGRFGYRLIVPPLRERKRDLPFLIDYTLQLDRFNPRDDEGRRQVEAFERGVIGILEGQEFPANFRELEERLGRAVINARLSGRKILLVRDLEDPAPAALPAPPPSTK